MLGKPRARLSGSQIQLRGYRYTLDAQNKFAHRMAMIQEAVLPPQLCAIGTKGSHESLGTKTIDGLVVEGSRIMTVLPEGAVGNNRPITIVSESWFSPDLRETIESTHSDPRSGDSVTRLTNIDRNNLDPSLFEVPAGYEIVDDPAPNAIRFERAK
ncbi:MAG: hypothetical protein WB676_03680 [Bryobacteraceae bacterium]